VLWDSVQSVPLENITGIEYEKEFSDLTIKLKIGEAGERISFYEELEGINFYKFMKLRRWEG
jgi:hypothetical protein